MLAWLSVWNEAQTCIWPSWCHCHSLSLASVKSRSVLPFWYRLTRVVPGEGPLNVSGVGDCSRRRSTSCSSVVSGRICWWERATTVLSTCGTRALRLSCVVLAWMPVDTRRRALGSCSLPAVRCSSCPSDSTRTSCATTLSPTSWFLVYSSIFKGI